jgi:hypothetical protein
VISLGVLLWIVTVPWGFADFNFNGGR